MAARRTAVALVGVVAVSSAVRFALAWWLPVPWIFSDELRYAELGKSFAATGHFAIRDVQGLGYGPLYPIVIAPAYLLFDRVPDAYLAIKAINCALMSLAALPAYAIARRVVDRRWALTVAALAVAVPSLAYTGTVMTENLAYPLFLATVLAIVRALEAPTVGRQLAAAALVATGTLVRPQAIALLPALLTAIAAVSAGDVLREQGRLRPSELLRSLRRFLPTFAAIAAGLVVVAAWEWGRGRSLFDSFGSAAGVWHQDYSVVEVARWLLYHLSELDLYVGVLPFAAGLVLAVRSFRHADRAVRIVGAITVSAAFWILLTAAIYVSGLRAEQGAVPHLEDRYTFYLVPLLLVAFAAWLSGRVTASARVTAGVALVAALLPLAVPYRSVIRGDAIPDAFGLLPWAEVRDHRLVAADGIAIRVAAISLILGLLFFLLRPSRLPRLRFVAPLLVGLSFAAVLSATELRVHSVSATKASVIRSERAWVDARLPKGAESTIIWSGGHKPEAVWELEFFNRSVGPVYDLRESTGIGFDERRLRVAANGKLYAAGVDAPLRARYLLAQAPVDPVGGHLLAADERSGFRLFALGGSADRRPEIEVRPW